MKKLQGLFNSIHQLAPRNNSSSTVKLRNILSNQKKDKLMEKIETLSQ